MQNIENQNDGFEPKVEFDRIRWQIDASRHSIGLLLGAIGV